MFTKIFMAVTVVFVAIAGFLLAWPVPIEPVVWQAPPNPGYSGVFEKNTRLAGLELLAIGDQYGPEDVAIDATGKIYAATHDGWIVRLDENGRNPENWAETGGRPLGIDFDNDGNLIVADALRGLLSISPAGKVQLLADTADGVPILYADDVDVARDGKIYFSDASTRFGAKAAGGTMEASLLDIMEHGKTGRLLVFDPASLRARTLIDGLSFANGVAVSSSQQFVLVNETGEYQVIQYWIDGPKKGQAEPFIQALPAFPDNISTGLQGRFWVAFISPRNTLLDNLSEYPFFRKMVQRLPAFIRPKAKTYGHIIALDETGKVVQDLQDPDTPYPQNTSVLETEDFLYIGSLVTPVLGRLEKSKAGL